MKRITSVLLVLIMLLIYPVTANADNSIEGTEQIKATAYCLDGITSTGHHVRDGICAGPSWMVAEASDQGSWCAYVWTVEGEFIGIYEVLDNGGTDAIRNGYVLDIWCSSLDECREFMATTQGKILVKYVWAVG